MQNLDLNMCAMTYKASSLKICYFYLEKRTNEKQEPEGNIFKGLNNAFFLTGGQATSKGVSH